MGKKSSVAAGGGGSTDQITTTTTSPDNLKTLIHEHSLFFDQLVELIPARFFLPSYSDDKPWFPGLSKSEKNKFKAQTRENIIKSRRDRLDPSQPSSTLDLLKKSLAEENESSEEDDDDEEEEEEEEEEVEEEAERAQNKATLTGDRPVTYEELRERLHRRIAELSAGRNTRPESRLKQERKKEMKNKKKLKSETKKNKDKDAASVSDSGKRKREDGNDETFSKNKKKNKVVEPTDIAFGQVRIDGKENKKRKKKLSKEKELERAKRLEEVKKDPEKGKKISWKSAVSKAAGEKVHDDPKLLKQSIKRDKKRQQKNAEKWKERERTVAKAKAEKQSKRSDNIKERIHQKRMRKIEKREKKLMRPGFEGRKEGYINE